MNLLPRLTGWHDTPRRAPPPGLPDTTMALRGSRGDAGEPRFFAGDDPTLEKATLQRASHCITVAASTAGTENGQEFFCSHFRTREGLLVTVFGGFAAEFVAIRTAVDAAELFLVGTRDLGVFRGRGEKVCSPDQVEKSRKPLWPAARFKSTMASFG